MSSRECGFRWGRLEGLLGLAGAGEFRVGFGRRAIWLSQNYKIMKLRNYKLTLHLGFFLAEVQKFSWLTLFDL